MILQPFSKSVFFSIAVAVFSLQWDLCFQLAGLDCQIVPLEQNISHIAKDFFCCFCCFCLSENYNESIVLPIIRQADLSLTSSLKYRIFFFPPRFMITNPPRKLTKFPPFVNPPPKKARCAVNLLRRPTAEMSKQSQCNNGKTSKIKQERKLDTYWEVLNVHCSTGLWQTGSEAIFTIWK